MILRVNKQKIRRFYLFDRLNIWMNFKLWLEANNIFMVSYNSYGDIKIHVNGTNYLYHTNDGALAKRLYEKGKYQSGYVLNLLKKFPYEKESVIIPK